MNDFLSREFLEFVGSFTLVHQALIDLFKLTGIRARRYAEALAYIVFGRTTPPPGAVARRRSFVMWGALPANWPAAVFGSWQEGPEATLIQSFLLRTVGDSPVADVSDSDIENAVRIARRVAGPELERASLLLDELVRRGVTKADDIAMALGSLSPTSAPLVALVQRWLGEIAGQPVISVALLADWRRELNQRLIPGVERAQAELANALKAAEYRYHGELHLCSLALAIIEGAAIGCLSASDSSEMLLNGIVAAGLLLVLPRGTKSLTDALLGIGARLRG